MTSDETYLQAEGPLYENHDVASSSASNHTRVYSTRFLAPRTVAPKNEHENIQPPSVNNRNVDYLTQFSAQETGAPTVAYGKNFVKRQVSSFDKIFGSSQKTKFQEEIQMAVKGRRRDLDDEASEEPKSNQINMTASNDYLEVTEENEYVNMNN